MYTANLVVANKLVDVRGAGATITSTSGDTLTVNDSGSLNLQGATVTSSGTTGSAIDCKSINNVDVPRLSLVDAKVESVGRGVRLWHCAATLRRVSVRATTDSPFFGIAQSTADVYESSFQGGGVADETILLAADNSLLFFRNSVIGNPMANGAGTLLSAGGCIRLSFSTVINATGQGVLSTAVCSGPTANGLCIENSIFLNLVPGAATNTVTGGSAIAGYSLTFPQTAPLPGAGNKNTNPMLLSPSTGDYHLKAGSPAVDAADPTATQMIDYTGKARPQGAGRDMGAFEYP